MKGELSALADIDSEEVQVTEGRATIQKGNSVTVESYTYDYAGNRLSKTVNENDTTYYVNAPAEVLLR